MFWTVVVLVPITCILLEKFLRSLGVSDFGNKYVLITGCDTGFGQELASRLDTLGFHVFAGCLTEDGAKSLSESCSSRLTAFNLDVSKSQSREAALKTVKQKLPEGKGLWALVNNAGVAGNWGPSDLCTKDDFLPIFEINFFGLTEMTRLFLPLVRQSQGRIVNMASIAARLAFVAAPYTCSKFAVEAYSDIIRRELYLQGVKVCVLEPGVFRTPIFDVEKLVAPIEKAYEKASENLRAVYGSDLIDRCRKRLTLFKEGGSPDTSVVVEAYIHALTARFPRKRYTVGKDAGLTFLPLSYLPSWLSDWFISSQVFPQGV